MQQKSETNSYRFRIHLLGAFEIWKRAEDGTWTFIEKAAWGSNKYPQSVLKCLLAAPGRRLPRWKLLECLWPDSDLADKYLNNAISSIRTIIGKDLLRMSDSSYELAGPEVIWVDSEVCQQTLKTVENLGGGCAQAVPMLEEALSYLERGAYLEAESATWCHGLRKPFEMLLRQCRLWLAEGYEVQGKLLQAGLQYQALCYTMPPDEEALQGWLEMLARQGKTSEALKCYQDVKGILESQGYTISPVIATLVSRRKDQHIQASLSPAQSPQNIREGELRSAQYTKEQGMGLSRRNLLQGFLGTTGTILLPGELYLDLETLERLSKALCAPSDIDEGTLMQLGKITEERRYMFVRSDGSTWQEIFQEMSGHLRILANLLEKHLQHPQIRTITGETALLLGDLLFNAGKNNAADTYYQGALDASQGNNTLRTVILGRKALVPIYDRNPQKAISLIDDAQRIAPAATADCIVAFLWAIKAEAYAALGDATLCFRALHSAEQLMERGRAGEISLSFRPDMTNATFNLTKLSGYKGACLLRLNRSEDAQRILYDQLALVKEQGLIHQQSIAMADLATSFGQQAAIRQAHEYATDALTCVEQTKSVRVFQRILKLRSSLHPWVNTTYIKSLDEHIKFIACDLAKGNR